MVDSFRTLKLEPLMRFLLSEKHRLDVNNEGAESAALNDSCIQITSCTLRRWICTVETYIIHQYNKLGFQ